MIILGVTSSSDKNVPTAPTIGTATNVGTGRAYNNGAATVTFTPTYSGGLPVTYTATSSPGGFTASGSASPLTVTGLQSNTAYTFTVTATNSLGTSAPSAASNSITATTVPQAPTIGTATDGGTGTTVSVAFTAGATGGSAITTFTATSSPGSITGTGASSPITVSGLTTGTAYTFTVTATNANGTSTASSASNSVTPAVPTAFDSIATSTTSGQSTYTFSSIPTTYTHLQLRCFYPGAAGSLSLRLNGDSGSNRYSYEDNEYNGTSQFTNSNTGATSMLLAGNVVNIGGSEGTAYIINIYNVSNTNTAKVVTWHVGYDMGSGARMVGFGSGCYNQTTNITSVSILTSSSTETGVSVALYGIT